MKRTLTCIICPNGCEMELEQGEGGSLTLRGAGCPRGEAYARQEMTDPQRTIASSVRLRNGELPLVSVRLSRPVPKRDIFPIMEEIRKAELEAPVRIGQCVIANVLGTGSDVIVTKNVARRKA